MSSRHLNGEIIHLYVTLMSKGNILKIQGFSVKIQEVQVKFFALEEIQRKTRYRVNFLPQ
jgi:hypothetical protein